MPAPTNEVYQFTIAANANANCPNGAGVFGGIFVSSASNTPTLTVLDAIAPAAGNTNAIVQTFTPVSATFYRVPARFQNGCQVVVGGNVSYTMFWNR